MIKEALQYLVALGQVKLFTIYGQEYSNVQLNHIKSPAPAAVRLSTLTGLIDYIKGGLDGLVGIGADRIVHVVSPTCVELCSQLKGDMGRNVYIQCVADTPKINFGVFSDTEPFIIGLQSCFLPNEDRAKILQIVGNIREENVKTTGDDGVGQTVTARVGITKVAEISVPNPVILAPYRTFQEIEQPESSFIFRMQTGPKAALFEADGGSWRNEVMLRIKEYLTKELSDCNVTIIA